jgi:hypothetical protein
MPYLSAPIIDVRAGIMATVLPEFTAPVFLRLTGAEGDPVDRARQAYVRAANADLRTCTAGWRDGAGVLVHAAPPDDPALVAEVHEVARALRALGDAAVAHDFLDIMSTPAGRDDGSGANSEGG